MSKIIKIDYSQNKTNTVFSKTWCSCTGSCQCFLRFLSVGTLRLIHTITVCGVAEINKREYTRKKSLVEPESTVPYLISVCLARSSADSMGDCIRSTVRNAARLAVYDEMMISVKNHQTLPTMRPDIDLRPQHTQRQPHCIAGGGTRRAQESIWRNAARQ